MSKPKVGIFGLTGCAGCQLAIINCEDELLDIVGAVDLKSFVMAQSNNEETEFDVAFVEGSVVTREDEHYLKEIRSKSGILVAIGSCACFGGIQAAANDREREDLLQIVYGTKENFYEARKVAALHEVVKVELQIPGCPIEKSEIISGIASLLRGDTPLIPTYPVCLECKYKENLCLLKERGDMCLGPVTRAGCDARCPSHGVACRGCRGPVEEANTASEYSILLEKGYAEEDIKRALRTFAYATELKEKL